MAANTKVNSPFPFEINNLISAIESYFPIAQKLPKAKRL
jgi:hypothetical protein